MFVCWCQHYKQYSSDGCVISVTLQVVVPFMAYGWLSKLPVSATTYKFCILVLLGLFCFPRWLLCSTFKRDHLRISCYNLSSWMVFHHDCILVIIKLLLQRVFTCEFLLKISSCHGNLYSLTEFLVTMGVAEWPFIVKRSLILVVALLEGLY